MSRNVYFGNDFYKFLLCIRYDFFDIFLSIKAAITLTVWFHVTVCKYFAVSPCACLRQFGVFLYFDSPALIFCQMPVETIHFVDGHHVDHSFYLIFTEEMSAFVQHKTSPFETGSIFNLDRWETPL